MEIKKGAQTSEVQLAVGTILAFFVAKFTGFDIGAEMMSNITGIVIAIIGGRTGLKAIPSIITAILARKLDAVPPPRPQVAPERKAVTPEQAEILGQIADLKKKLSLPQ
jgi:hypothetical protein